MKNCVDCSEDMEQKRKWCCTLIHNIYRLINPIDEVYMSPYNFYRVEKKEHVAFVSLNRPEKKNAMGPAAWTEPVEIFAELDADPNIRAIVISGEGPCFSAGIDLMGMVPELSELMDRNQFGGTKWKLLPKICSQDTASRFSVLPLI